MELPIGCNRQWEEVGTEYPSDRGSDRERQTVDFWRGRSFGDLLTENIMWT